MCGKMSMDALSTLPAAGIALLGGLGMDDLRNGPVRAADAVRNILSSAPGKGFALGSSAGVLDSSLDTRSVLASFGVPRISV